jgi:hypothetical protein
MRKKGMLGLQRPLATVLQRTCRTLAASIDICQKWER